MLAEVGLIKTLGYRDANETSSENPSCPRKKQAVHKPLNQGKPTLTPVPIYGPFFLGQSLVWVAFTSQLLPQGPSSQD